MSIDVTAGTSLSARVAEEIRVVMARRLMRQSELARKIGVGEQWLSVRLRGKQPIDLNDLQRIADGLEVQPGALLSSPGTTRQSASRPRRNRNPTVETGHSNRAKTSSRPPSYPGNRSRPMLVGGHTFG